MTEIEQLRADLKRLQECQEIHMKHSMNYSPYTAHVIQAIEEKIAQLEAEAADPWREAKSRLEDLEEMEFHRDRELARYVRHLEAENATKDAHIAELEAELVAANEILRGRETRMTQAKIDPREAEMEAKHANLHDALREAQQATPKEHGAAILKAANDSLAMKLARATEEIEAMKAREVPPLDPKRVIRTAMSFMACNSCPYRDWNYVEPYPLQEPK